MRALVFKDFGEVELADVPKPALQEPGDALVRVTTTAICGSDLHVLNGRIPGMRQGSVIGHEFVGVVEDASPEVARFKPGDRVLASFTVPCGHCWYCDRRWFSRCAEQRVFGYGSFLGDLDGAQAEYVRVPNADFTLRTVDDALNDEQVLFAGDIFATGFDCAAEAQIEREDSVVVVGCGPVGLMAIQAAKTFEPATIFAVDSVSQRLEMAQTFGAVAVDASAVHAASFIQDRTGGRGADRVLECVGMMPALLDSLDYVRSGGRISVIGVHSDPDMPLPLSITFVRAIDLKFCGTANVVGRWNEVFPLLEQGRVKPEEIISHRMPLSEGVRGYELFESREALKVVLTP